jgi:hypothetical protein
MRPSLLNAYRMTRYEVGDIDIRIGRRSSAMDNLMRSLGVRQAAFITAYNPFSRTMPPGWNQRMLTRLASTIRRRALRLGRGSWRRWSEVLLVVFGDIPPMVRLARRFRQYGILTIRIGQPARLRLVSRLA